VGWACRLGLQTVLGQSVSVPDGRHRVAKYEDQGDLAISVEQLWAFLRQHLDPEQITRIHGDVLAQRVLESGPDSTIVERRIRFGRKTVRSIWKLSYSSPGASRWEILEGDGPIATGSYLVNTYTPIHGGVRVATRGEIAVVGFPKFLQGWIVRTALGRIDHQDQVALGLLR
jgi:hypothetical protein